jgi:integrase/recombinase XerD
MEARPKQFRYLEHAGHGADIEGPLFRPLRNNGRSNQLRRLMNPDAIDRVLRKHAAVIGLTR